MALTIGPGSLVIVSSAFNSGVFQQYTNAGMTHTTGTTLNIAAGQAVSGIGSINDPVICQGRITANPNGSLGLKGGLTLSGSGVVNLGPFGVLSTDNTASSLSGGSLSAYSQYVGYSGSGSFTQSGGINSYSSGTANICGPSLYLGYQAGGMGSYTLSGGTLQCYSIQAGAGIGTFNFNGGVLQPSSSAGATILNLTAAYVQGGGAIIDTHGQTVTILQSLLDGGGGGGLTVRGGGVLTLYGTNTNTFTGNTLISGGTLVLNDNATALQNSTLDASGAGLLSSAYTSITLGGIQGGGNLSLRSGFSLNVGNNNTNTTYSGAMRGAGGLYKIGNGLLLLSGYNTYTGGTTVIAGTVAITGALLGGTAGAVTAECGGTIFLNGNATVSAANQYIGNLAAGTLIQAAGTNSVSNTLYIGYTSGSGGTYSLAGNAMLSASNEYVGDFGAGSLLQSSGTNSCANVYLGYDSGSGTYNLNGSGYLSSSNEYVGNAGKGLFVQSSGTNTVSGSVVLGSNYGGSGTYNLSGSGLLSVGGSESVGFYGGGGFAQSGGTNSIGKSLYLGCTFSYTGTYNLGSGLLTVGGSEDVGYDSRGIITQTGGTNSIGTTLLLGYDSSSNGTYNLNGGLLVVGGLSQGSARQHSTSAAARFVPATALPPILQCRLARAAAAQPLTRPANQ